MRLHHLPDRLQFVEMDASIAKEEHFKAESRYWDDIIASYIHSFHWRNLKLRNAMDMRAGFGGYLVTLIFSFYVIITWCLRYLVEKWNNVNRR